MKVIGAGFGRTGTMSMQAALQELGYPCYHMNNVLADWEHLNAWYDFALSRATMDWKTLFRDYEATVDFPACLYYKELMEIYPEAVVVLNVRDPDPWFSSWSSVWKTRDRYRVFRFFVPRLRLFHGFVDAVLFNGLFGGKLDHGHNINVFRQHIEDVKATVPPDRLLVFNVKEGWGPLCTFLGCEIPEGKPFPHLNEGSATIVMEFTKRVTRDAIKLLVVGGVLLSVALALWRAFS